MIRKAVILVLTASAIGVAAIWVWCRIGEGAIGGWTFRLGRIAFGHEGYGHDLVLSLGSHPPTGWRPTAFGEVAGLWYSIGQGYGRFSVPFWFPFVLLIAYPVYVLVRGHIYRRLVQERQVEGRCTKCGYDLTGLPKPRCPECSTPVSTLAVSARRILLLRLGDDGLLFVCLGIGSAILFWTAGNTLSLIASPFFGLTDWAAAFFDHLAAVSAAGALMGLVWCSFGVPLLFRKPIRRIVQPLAWVVSTACVVLVFTGIFFPPIHSVWLAVPALTVVVAATCVILRRVTPHAAVPGQDRSAKRTSSERQPTYCAEVDE